MSTIVKAAVALGILWAAVLGIMWVAGYFEVTPEKIAAYTEAHPISDIEDPADREAHIRKLADMVNHLEFDERREARERQDPASREMWQNLTPAERALMVELTMGTFFDNMMKAFNKMEPEERKRVAEDTIAQLKKGDQMRPGEAEQLEERGVEMFEKVMSEGLRSYYQEASAETKIDFAPVLEEMQTVMQDPRRRWKRERELNYKKGSP